MDARSSAFSIVSDRLMRLADSALSAPVDIDPVLRLLSHADVRTLRDSFVGIDQGARSLTVQLRWPEDPHASQQFFDFHAIGFTVQNDRAQPLLELYSGDPLIDVEVAGDAVGCTLHVPGSRPLAEDIDALVEVARTDPIRRDAMVMVCAPLAELTDGHCDGIADRILTDGRSRWYVRFIVANDAPETMARTIQAVQNAGAQLAITETQLGLFMKVHPALSQRRPTIVSMSMTDGHRDQCVGLEYAPMDWDSARSLMRSVHGSTGAARIAALARVTGARQAAMLRLELRHIEPPSLQVWAELLPEAS